MDLTYFKNIKNLNDFTEKDINKEYIGGNKLIHLIIIHKKDDLLKQYLDKKFNLNLIDINNNTPYHLLLTQFYNIDKFIKISNSKTCWNNINKNEESILDIIFSNPNTFKKLDKIHHLFMNKTVLQGNKNNYNNICKFLLPQDIIKFQNIINFSDFYEPAFLELNLNPNISTLSDFIKKLNDYKKYLDITDTFGNNLLFYYITKNKNNINDKFKKEIFNLLDLGFNGNYINIIQNGGSPFKLLLLYSDDNKFLTDFYKKANVDANQIDNYGNNLGHFTILYYQKYNKTPDKLFDLIVSESNKNVENIFGQTINSMLNIKNNKNNKNINYSNLKLVPINYANYTEFRARFDDTLLYMYLLTKKYKNITVPTFDKHISKLDFQYDFDSISSPINLDLNLNDLPLVIFYENPNSYFIHPYLNLLIEKISNKKEYDYAMVFLSLQGQKGDLHANILIYDFKNKTIQRFEPYGNTTNIDSKLDDILEEELTWNIDMKYNTVSNIIDSSGFQSLSDETNILLQKPGDFGGFCLAWCFWFVEMRITNDILSKDFFYKSIKKIIKQEKVSLIDYIRSYSNKITDEKYNIYKKINIPKHVWSNITFDNHHLLIIQDFIKKWLNIS